VRKLDGLRGFPSSDDQVRVKHIVHVTVSIMALDGNSTWATLGKLPCDGETTLGGCDLHVRPSTSRHVRVMEICVHEVR